MSKYTLHDGAILCEGTKIAEYDAERNAVRTDEPLPRNVKIAISRLIVPPPDYESARSSDSTVIAPPARSEKEPEPSMSSGLGDKDPVYVAWFKRNHTEEEFQARYGGRKFTMSVSDATREHVVPTQMRGE